MGILIEKGRFSICAVYEDGEVSSLKKYIGLEDMGNVNCSRVLDVIRRCGPVSRKQISDITGLSWGGMTKIVNKLFDHGYIVEEKDENGSGAGRTPGLIRVNGNRHVVAGFDLNREGFEARVMNLCGDVLKTYGENIVYEGKEDLLRAILGFIGGVLREYEEKNVLSAGIAMQGVLDVDRGISVRFPQCPGWEHIPVREILEQKFGIDVFVEHDPNCILYSLMKGGAGGNMLLFRLDRSIGMAASVHGEILRGNGLLEVAHCIVAPGGKPCRCGKKGCMEAYLAPCIKDGKPDRQALRELLDPLAVFMHNMVRMFHSDTVIVTGKLVRYRDNFEKELLACFYRYCPPNEVEVRLVEEAGLAVGGAALIAAQGAVDRLRI